MSLLRPPSDIWRVGIAYAPIGSFLTANMEDMRITWLPPQPSFCFLADPFGIAHGQSHYVFAEGYDYRNKRGKIVFYEYSNTMELLRSGDALVKPYHLSYPFIVQHGGEVYMLPESHRGGTLTLYRARNLPDDWEPVCDLLPDIQAIDASLIWHDELWWMFYSVAGNNKRAIREMHVACAPALTGPWQLHKRKPVHVSVASSRMGGTPFTHEGKLYLPTQDCTHTYGGALSLVRVDTLTPEEFSCSVARHLPPAEEFAPFTDGFHTLSSFGDMTLIDAKRIHRSPMRHLINWQRRLQRLSKNH